MAPASLTLHPSVQLFTAPPGSLPLAGGCQPRPPSPQQNCSPSKRAFNLPPPLLHLAQ
ncbi:hypothetical protein E2C01_059849 [Portunus trituberculatus]|uniref:Uncharacterized protein n=1 Tax=Portunus trituberculatus TaxID=210409 RepID=A0A5B7H6H6_PORTR|nr:hypothetical protein [Portunus trituberculatus]